MYENYREMSADEKAQVKSIYKAIRKETPSRLGNLAWAFVRGMPYRRVERTTRTQVLPEGKTITHNRPDPRELTWFLASHIPGFVPGSEKAARWNIKPSPAVEAWLANTEGAIPAPAPRAKKPFIRPEVA